MYSKAYRNLTANAIRLLEILSLKFHKERERELDFPVARNFGIEVLGLSKNSGNSIERALDNLVRWGFLDQTYISTGGGENSQKPNRFMFSERWQQYG